MATTLILETTIDGIRSQIETELSTLMLDSIALVYIQAARSIGTENEAVVAVTLARIGLAGKISAQLIASTIISSALVGGRRLAWSARRSMFASTTDLQLKVVDDKIVSGSGCVHANTEMRVASNRLGKIDLFEA